MTTQKMSAVVACAALFSLGACGSDSTGPDNLEADAALQSLRLGLGAVSDIEGPSGATMIGSLGLIAPMLDKVTVDIDGTSRTMFALGVRDSYPAETCVEQIFVNPEFPPPPGLCTPASLGVVLLLWQSHSAAAPPDRLIFILTGEGTTNFSFTSPASLPGFAFYLEGKTFWVSSTGTVSSQIASAGSSCTIPFPEYAKSATCSLATFTEQGTITFETDASVSASARRTLTISPQTVDGVWLAITELQPLGLQTAAPLRGLMRSRATP